MCVCLLCNFLFFLFLLQIFDRLRKESPDVIKNVRAIEANFEAHDLNISQENKNIIWDEVDVRDVVCFVEYRTSFVHCFFFSLCASRYVSDIQLAVLSFRLILFLIYLFRSFLVPFFCTDCFQCGRFGEIQ